MAEVTRTIIFRPEARAEFDDAYDFYEGARRTPRAASESIRNPRGRAVPLTTP